MNVVLGIVIIILIGEMGDETKEINKLAYSIPLSFSIIAVAVYNIIRIFA